MITVNEVERMNTRSTQELRMLAALIAGLLVERCGSEETASIYRRIVGDPQRAPQTLHG